MKESEHTQIDWLFADSLLKFAQVVPVGAREVIASLMAAARAGHLCIPIDDAALLPKELVESVTEALPQKPLCLYGNLLYLQKNWLFETRVLKHIRRLQEETSCVPFDSSALPTDLNAEQRAAVQQALTSGVSLITGGPGTGKTYTAARLISTFHNTGAGRIAVAAPTGKAASALERALSKIMELPTEMTVGTIHALLGDRLRREEEIPLPFDLIIVDESSMIDAPLFATLLASVPKESHLVLMGDPHQLPPVEVGSLFADILSLELFPSVCLTQCMRSSGPILELASAVRAGDSEAVITQIQAEGVLIHLGFSQGSISSIYEKLWNYVKGKFSCCFARCPQDEELLHALLAFRILSCLRSGPLGVDALNTHLVKQFYMEACMGEYVAFPIIVTQSDAELELFNGQMGVLVKKKKSSQFEIAFDDILVFPGRRLSAAIMPHYTFAYALSVHKAQGSEYDEVLLLVPPGSEHFGREVLYTAITRTKHALQIDGNLEIIKEAIETSSKKRSGLAQRIVSTLQPL